MGRAIARRLAREGVGVYINYRASSGEGDSLVNEIRSSCGQAIAVSADIDALPIPLPIAIKQLAAGHRLRCAKLAGSQARQRRGVRCRFSASHFKETLTAKRVGRNSFANRVGAMSVFMNPTLRSFQAEPESGPSAQTGKCWATDRDRIGGTFPSV